MTRSPVAHGTGTAHLLAKHVRRQPDYLLRTAFDESPYRDGWGYEERPIAVESLGGITDDQSDLRVLFRDANALGALQYENPHVGASDRESTGLALAAAMHRDWRGD